MKPIRIEYDALHILAPFLNSEKYQIYSTLYCDSTKYLSLEYEQSTQAHKKDVRNLVKDYTPQDVECLLQVCIESIQLFDKDERNLIIGLQYVFDAIKDRASLFLYLTESYIQADTPYNVGAGSIVENLFSFMPVQEVKTFITKHHFRQQNTWLWYFYTQMPEDKISQSWVNDLFDYLNAPDKTLISSPYRWLESLQRYTAIDSKIYLKALRIITDHYEDSPFVFSLYVFDILNHGCQQDIDKVLSNFAGELPLLEEVYIKGIFYSNQADHDGALLHALITLDPKFLYKYLDTLVSIHKKDRFNRSFDHTQLLRIWDTECYIKLANAVFDHLCKNRDEIHWLNHSPLHIMSRKNSTQLITSTFKTVWEQRHPTAGLIFHSDRGAQYTSHRFRQLLHERSVEQSFSNSGKPHDNAVAESFFATLKKEDLYRKDYTSEASFKRGLASYIEFYNTQRPHRTLKNQTPCQVEEFFMSGNQ